MLKTIQSKRRKRKLHRVAEGAKSDGSGQTEISLSTLLTVGGPNMPAKECIDSSTHVCTRQEREERIETLTSRGNGWRNKTSDSMETVGHSLMIVVSDDVSLKAGIAWDERNILLFWSRKCHFIYLLLEILYTLIMFWAIPDPFSSPSVLLLPLHQFALPTSYYSVPCSKPTESS